MSTDPGTLRGGGGFPETPIAFDAPGCRVSALLVRPPEATALLLLAHGAGAGMRHSFMDEMAALLGERAIATLRYQFPYMERGRRAPNVPRILTGTVRQAVEAATRAAPDLPLFAGGKSMGGRMTSLAASAAPLPGVRGIAFLGFPLHGLGKAPNTERSEHLARVRVPLLFVQGTRDRLANLDLLGPVARALGARASLHIVQGGDHSFKVLKRSGRSHREVMVEVADAVAAWMEKTAKATA